MKSNAILALLAATRGHRHSRRWFQTLLWGDRQHEQGLSSLRSALADIRRHLGPHKNILITTNADIALKPDHVQTDLKKAEGRAGQFLEGFDVPHADGFEDWLREARAANCSIASRTHADVTPLEPIRHSPETPNALHYDLYLAAGFGARDTITHLKCDALVDGLAKSFEEFGLGRVIDGRFAGSDFNAQRSRSMDAGCTLMLIMETADSAGGSMARLKVVNTESGRLIWSKSIFGPNGLDIEDPNTIAVVAEFIDVMAHTVSREISWTQENLSPDLLALAGINQAFKLGAQNFELADNLLKKAHAMAPKGVHLAWRGFLRSFALCELEYASPEVVIEEGTTFARRALELDPHNSMVLALCAHVENVITLSPERALELSTRALEINRCNPMAWASMGLASSFLGNAEAGQKLTQVGARLSSGNWYSAQAESWASAASVMADDVPSAVFHAQRSHRKSRDFAPPMRYLSALYCLDGHFDRAVAMADRLKTREPDFSLSRLKDDGYPVQSLRKAGILHALPRREV